MDKSRRWNLGYDQHRVGVSSSHRSSIQLRYLAIRRDTSSYVELVEIDDQPRIASRIAPFPSTRGSLERSGGAEEEEEVARERFVQQKNIRSVSRARFLRSICPDFFLRRFDAICTPPSPIQLTVDTISR